MPPWSSSSEVCWRVRCALWEIFQILCWFFLPPDPPSQTPYPALSWGFPPRYRCHQQGRGSLQQQPRSVGAGCAAASAWQQNTARPGGNSLGQTSVLFEGSAGIGHWELGLCFLLPPLLLIFIWSLANHLPSMFPSCTNTWVPSAPSCLLVWFWFSFSFHGGMLFFDLGYFGNNFQITR